MRILATINTTITDENTEKIEKLRDNTTKIRVEKGRKDTGPPRNNELKSVSKMLIFSLQQYIYELLPTSLFGLFFCNIAFNKVKLKNDFLPNRR